ncbi:permease [Candidatus Woesearchaeota archaeon]|nr:permease [Candidatus Woesearchaeota archaeon]
MTGKKTSKTGWYFLLAVIALYLIVGLLKPESILPSLNFFWQIIKQIFWVFIIVFVLFVIINYFIQPKQVVKYLGKKAGVKGWLMAIIGGIISIGPPYMWYPLLKEMRKHGTRNGLLVAFLYNWAVKPALLPLLIFYFGWIFTIVLTIVMMVMSIIQGLLVEKLLEIEK